MINSLNLSLNDKISALYLCADILDYPDDNYYENIKLLENLINHKFTLQEVLLEDVCSEYIRIFSIDATKSKCVPYASWWIDGKMSGKTLLKIVDFYKSCGYEFDADSLKKPADNISSMISFAAILAEDKKHKELKDFTKYLNWLDDFAKSLEKTSDAKTYKNVVEITIKILNSLKGEL